MVNLTTTQARQSHNKQEHHVTTTSSWAQPSKASVQEVCVQGIGNTKVKPNMWGTKGGSNHGHYKHNPHPGMGIGSFDDKGGQ